MSIRSSLPPRTRRIFDLIPILLLIGTVFNCSFVFAQSHQAERVVANFYATMNRAANSVPDSDEYFKNRNAADQYYSLSYSKLDTSIPDTIETIRQKGGIAEHKILNVGTQDLYSDSDDFLTAPFFSENEDSYHIEKIKFWDIQFGVPVTHEIRFNDGSRITQTSRVCVRHGLSQNDFPELIQNVLEEIIGTKNPGQLYNFVKGKSWNDIFGNGKNMDILRRKARDLPDAAWMIEIVNKES